MQLTCPQSQLAEVLAIVSKAISPQNTLPVLHNINIAVVGDKAVFTATNLEIAIRITCPIIEGREGAITVPAKVITSYVGLLPDEPLSLRVEGGTNLVLKTDSSETKIHGISSDEFPIIPSISEETSFSISSTKLAEMLGNTIFACSSNASRPILAGISVNISGDQMVLASTDSFRLSEQVYKIETPVSADVSCIIPVKTVSELHKVLQKYPGEDVLVVLDKNQIMFRFKNVEIMSRLIEGSFPDYRRIIPDHYKTRVRVPLKDFMVATKKVNLFVSENSCLKIQIQGEKMDVHTDETQVGTERDSLIIEGEGEQENSISLNSHYLLDILQRIDNDSVVLEMTDRLSPVVVKDEKNNDFIHLIMPLKV